MFFCPVLLSCDTRQLEWQRHWCLEPLCQTGFIGNLTFCQTFRWLCAQSYEPHAGPKPERDKSLTCSYLSCWLSQCFNELLGFSWNCGACSNVFPSCLKEHPQPQARLILLISVVLAVSWETGCAPPYPFESLDWSQRQKGRSKRAHLPEEVGVFLTCDW